MQSRQREGFIGNSIHQGVDNRFIQVDSTTVHGTHFTNNFLDDIDFKVGGFGFATPPVMEDDFTIAKDEAIFSHELFRYTDRLLLYYNFEVRVGDGRKLT
jgi:hypothetical protein